MVVIGNASQWPSHDAVVVMVLAPPPLRNNLPVGCWPPLERHNNQPPMDRPPLGVVLPPLEGESFGVLLVWRVLCCVVPKNDLRFFKALAGMFPSGIHRLGVPAGIHCLGVPANRYVPTCGSNKDTIM